MMTPTSSPRTSRQPYRLAARLPPGSVFGIFGLLMLALPTVSHAQQAAPSGEELYIDRLGCWTCHGSSGKGGGEAGAPIANTQLPLWKFVKYLRLPTKSMPPYARSLASDAHLAIVYRWLDGVDAVATPTPVTVALEASVHPRADGQSTGQAEVELKLASDVPQPTPLRYRVTLATRDTPVANRTFEHKPAGRGGWSTLTTDEQGQAVLGPDGGAPARLRVALAPGRYALVVEVIDYTEPAKPVVVGIGTAIVNVE